VPQRQSRTLLVLVSLLDSPKHGYAIMSDIKSFAGTTLGPGTLYGAIAALERAGLIEAVSGGENDGRRAYKLTEDGLTRVRSELRDLDTVAREGNRRLAIT
jgi:DNA-binding PadR family transcriptional regulator